MTQLRVRDLGKAYKRYARKSGRLAEWVGLGVHHDLTWVLRDVGFEVQEGEAVAIVGANGAGKSTLLKLIAGTIRPTRGTVEAKGRVAALLELGLGFHPEFTGRQNVYMAGHLLGMSSQQTSSLMESIEAFAEIGEYIERPVRTYSSGMQMRLAFSVATAIRPDLLIVDEALTVGDTYFQHKSFSRIREFRDQGTTLLFVSHSAGSVKTLCQRALLLDKGVLLRDDSPDTVLDFYNALIAAQHVDFAVHQTNVSAGHTVTRSGNSQATIDNVRLISDGRPVHAVRSGDPVSLRIAISVHGDLDDLTVGILIRDKLGNDVFGTNTFHLGKNLDGARAGSRIGIAFSFPELRLGVGSYSVTVALHSGAAHVVASYDWWDRALVFQVFAGSGPITIGVCDLPVTAERMPERDLAVLEANSGETALRRGVTAQGRAGR